MHTSGQCVFSIVLIPYNARYLTCTAVYHQNYLQTLQDSKEKHPTAVVSMGVGVDRRFGPILNAIQISVDFIASYGLRHYKDYSNPDMLPDILPY